MSRGASARRTVRRTLGRATAGRRSAKIRRGHQGGDSESDGSGDRAGRSGHAREISKMANISAMDAARAALAQGTGRCSGASMNRYDHAIRVDDDLLNRKAGWEQRQQRSGQEDSTF